MSESSVALPYTISQCSAHSGRYIAENILVDSPMDQSSRWSGAYPGNAKQWIILRLETLVVLKSITFGKFYKPHPCNMKEFKLFVGVNEEHMSEVLHSGLKNDSISETFPIKHVNKAGVCFPTRYVKIVPFSAHGQSFHTSIWHVAMTGITDPAYVEQVLLRYDKYRETAVLRHLLKHLRQRRLLTPYESIISRSGIQFEHPLITQLHESIVLRGDWQRAEQLVSIMSKAGLFDSYLHASQPHAVWKRLHGTDADGDVPSPRGGHAMCIDPVNDIIYLFGGWDGQKSLDDFWMYSVKDNKWRVLSHGTSEEQNAPGARSCHKMVFDTKTGSIYLLGRLSDSDSLKPTNDGSSSRQQTQPSTEDTSNSAAGAFYSEFYRYHTRGVDAGKWDFLSFDTASSYGPPLVFDHQMVIDCDSQILYVFGGRVVDGDWDAVRYSGLYSYNIRLSKWKLLQPADTSNTLQVIIPPRFGHSMVLEPSSRALFIFAGQRDDKYLSDMYAFDLVTNTATELYSSFTAAGGPDACFTQRAVIDSHLREIYVFCGLTRSPQVGSTTTVASEAPNWVFRYDPRPGSWTQILPQLMYTGGTHDTSGSLHAVEKVEEPLPRYAHQVVYNPRTKTVFMHGGNAGMVGQQLERGRGDDSGKERRLDDFWRMTLIRPGSEEVIRMATYRIRRQQFREMCEEMPPIKALNFLQTEISAVVDHTDAQEAEAFRSLLTYLLTPSSSTSAASTKEPAKEEEHDDLPPRKRSRSDPPDHDSDPDHERGDQEGVWTDKLGDEDEDEHTHSHSMRAVSAFSLQGIEDPLERVFRRERNRGSEDAGEQESSSGGGLSGARFSQRNEVFESMLQFVAESEKQPEGRLLDIIDVDMGGL